MAFSTTSTVGSATVDPCGLGAVQLWEGGPYWAECNVGASKPEDPGYYFWWGDTVGYEPSGGVWTGDWYFDDVTWVSSKGERMDSSPFNPSACPTDDKTIAQLQSAGYIDSTGILVPAHDAATAHLGAPWRMPTEAELSALVSNCDISWTARNGVYGWLVTGKGAYASKSIFLPLAGQGLDTDLCEPLTVGNYWLSSPSSDSPYYAWNILFDSGDFYGNPYCNRYFGLSVRPVREDAVIPSCTIEVDVPQVVFEDCKADSKRVGVTSSGGWSSSVKGGTGLTVTSAGSKGDSEAEFIVTENTTGEPREWDVVFTGCTECGDECTTTVHVTQGTCLPECELSVAPGIVTFGCARGCQTVRIEAPKSWSAQKLSGDADCTLSSTSGAGDATLTVSVTSNRTDAARSWSWQIASDCGVATLEVRQEACEPDCACSIETDTLLVEFENCEADFKQIDVTSSVNWSSRVNGGTGLSVTSSGLKGKSTAVFTVSENMTGNPREWDVVFTGRTACGDECSTTVHVTQGTCQLECRIRVTPSERVVNANWHFGFLTVTANDSWTLDAKSVPRWIVPLLRSGLAGTWCVPYIVRAQPDCGSGDAADSRRASLRFVNAQGCSDTFTLEQLGRECCTFLSIYREGEEQYAFTTNGAAFSLSLKVRSSSAWAAASEVDWIRIAAANQETDELTLEVLANPDEERRGEVRVTNADGDARIFTILQTPETLAVDPEHVLLLPKAGEVTVAIRSSADWTVRIPDEVCSWLSVSPDSGSGDGTITISVASNVGDDLRFAELSVAAGLIEKDLLVVQDTVATRLCITGPDTMRSDGTVENRCVVVSPGCEAEPVSPTWSVTGPDGIRIGTDGTVSIDGILLTQAVAMVTARYVVDDRNLVASREIEILPKPGPGVWTADVAAALAGAQGDGRLILTLASNYETCHFCRLFEPVARNPEFLKWAHDNGVYLIVATRTGPCGESVTDAYFWMLVNSFGHTGSVPLPSLAFAYPSDLYQGVGLDTGRVGNTIGTEEYDGTVVTLIEGVASYLKRWTVSYRPGEYGVGSEQTATKLNGVDLTLEGAIFTRSGYMQTGWSVTDGGAKSYELEDTYATDAEIVLYPYWTADPTEPAKAFAEALGVPGVEWGSCDIKYTLKIDRDWTCDGNGSVRTDDMSFQAERRCGISLKVKGPTSMKFSYSKSFSAATFVVDCGSDFLYKDDMPGIKTEWKQVILDIPAGEQTVYIYARPGYFFFNEENEYNGFWIDDLQFGDFEHEKVYLIDYDQGPGSELTTSAAQARPYSNPLTYTASDLPLVLADARPLKDGCEFVGWSMDGKMVTEIPKGTTGNIQLVAVWDHGEEPDPPQDGGGDGIETEVASRLYETLDLKYIWPKPYVGAAAVYDGYLSDADGIVRGTIQVKVAKGKTDRKTGKFAAKVTATVQMADGSKKISFKGGSVNGDVRGLISAMSAGGHVLNAQVGEYGLGGTMDGLTIDGARNVFTGKYEGDGAIANAANGYLGVYNLALKDGVLSVSIAQKGKVKVSGTVNGVKISATSQLLVGESACCVPVVISKKVNLAFNLWLSDGGSVEVVGLEGVVAGKTGGLKAGSKFCIKDNGAVLAQKLTGLYGDYLPNCAVVQSGTKWVVADGAKAGKLTLVRGTSEIDTEKSKITANTSGLKLSYKAKDGSFKGSFKAYNLENGKIKSYTVNVTGVMVGTKGYGTATVKKPSCTFQITIE